MVLVCWFTVCMGIGPRVRGSCYTNNPVIETISNRIIWIGTIHTLEIGDTKPFLFESFFFRENRDEKPRLNRSKLQATASDRCLPTTTWAITYQGDRCTLQQVERSGYGDKAPPFNVQILNHKDEWKLSPVDISIWKLTIFLFYSTFLLYWGHCPTLVI